MTALDLIKKDKAAVRQSAVLYPLYKSLFSAAFGREPVCPTCGSPEGHADWVAFGAFARGADPKTLTLKNSNMSQNKADFSVKDKSKIYSFNRENKKTGRSQTVRMYGDVMTQEFAEEYLSDKEKYNERAHQFSILPKKYRKEKDQAIPDADADKGKAAKGKDKAADADPGADFDTEDVLELPKTLKGLKEFAVEQEYPESEWAEIKTIKDMAEYVETKLITAADEDDLLG